MLPMAKHIIHISEAEAASDFGAVLARVRAGAEIVIEGTNPSWWCVPSRCVAV
jgi:hypothetical protein